MMREDRLAQAVARGARARALLEHELLIEAFQGLEQSYTAAWRATKIDDVAAREKLYLAINIVGKVRDHLTAVANNGTLGEIELKELVEVAERRRRFGIM
jgi:hypothetical protein